MYEEALCATDFALWLYMWDREIFSYSLSLLGFSHLALCNSWKTNLSQPDSKMYFSKLDQNSAIPLTLVSQWHWRVMTAFETGVKKRTIHLLSHKQGSTKTELAFTFYCFSARSLLLCSISSYFCRARASACLNTEIDALHPSTNTNWEAPCVHWNFYTWNRLLN